MNDTTAILEDHSTRVRNSPAGRNLTESQLDETLAICSIVAREIDKSGSFLNKLSDYVHAFARTERFDATKGEEIIRDVFRARYGETMNQRREGLMNRKAEIEPTISGKALNHARSVIELIRTAPTMPFYRAYDQVAVSMSAAYGITEKDAKEMMKAAFVSKEARELYDAGKEAEELYHKPTQQEGDVKERKSEDKTRKRQNWSRS